MKHSDMLKIISKTINTTLISYYATGYSGGIPNIKMHFTHFNHAKKVSDRLSNKLLVAGHGIQIESPAYAELYGKYSITVLGIMPKEENK